MGPVKKPCAWMVLTVLGMVSFGPATHGTEHQARCSAVEARSYPYDGTAGAGTSLFAQSSTQWLGDEFRGGEVSFLLLDAHTGMLLASRWDNPNSPIPLGSLVKPFTALAYAQ